MGYPIRLPSSSGFLLHHRRDPGGTERDPGGTGQDRVGGPASGRRGGRVESGTGDAVRIVGESGPTLERALRDGRLTCPRCGGALRPWGRARARTIRFATAGHRPVRPRRARCAGCRTTHVLLPDWVLVRRAYAAPVVWSALTAHARGLGYRRIALRMHLPETTVRDWLRAFRRTGPRLLGQLAHRVPAGASPVDAVEGLSAPLPAWRLAVRVSAGRLLANTSPPHPAGAAPSARPP